MTYYTLYEPRKYCDAICWFWCWPRGRPQRSDPGLEYTKEEGEGVFPDYNKVDAGQEDHSVDDEANDHSHHIHAQLPGYHFQVLNGDDLTTDETGNTEGRVPVQVYKLVLFLYI